ncbi:MULTISPECIES: hypothetical protein [unclassified Streptomyces]|uniref:hypothetical protein n=1 Tax=unclassified Streptomyces TaxID=2593676 RepID=UPI00225AD4DF|nr:MULTISPECIES: hypothetical protein [unclassified Streptomyces]MCX4649369.1 hypothetical protein [Streptomyces sp. NBC_01446]MCX5321432.1 hypothetical protein [Streptomyces sp. NBC_00120]
MDEIDQDINELLVRFDILEQILKRRGLQFDMPGERLRLEIGRAGEVVGDRPERHAARAAMCRCIVPATS